MTYFRTFFIYRAHRIIKHILLRYYKDTAVKRLTGFALHIHYVLKGI